MSSAIVFVLSIVPPFLFCFGGVAMRHIFLFSMCGLSVYIVFVWFVYAIEKTFQRAFIAIFLSFSLSFLHTRKMPFVFSSVVRHKPFVCKWIFVGDRQRQRYSENTVKTASTVVSTLATNVRERVEMFAHIDLVASHLKQIIMCVCDNNVVDSNFSTMRN